MLHPPEFERNQLPGEVSSKIARSFEEGRADEFAARSLVRAGSGVVPSAPWWHLLAKRAGQVHHRSLY